MACYISSNDERLYAAIETGFGDAAEVTAADRIPVVRFAAIQRAERPARRDKTGSRTFRGYSFDLRKQTQFEVKTYLCSSGDPVTGPAYGSLVQGALGGAPESFGGAEVASADSSGRITFTSSHDLRFGQAVTFGGEIRFVAAVPDAASIVLNHAFTLQPGPGAYVGGTVSYRPGHRLPSVSIYDYWSPETAVHRLVCGGGVDRMKILINGDFHELEFAGVAKDLIDSASFTGAGSSGLTSFPPEPTSAGFDYSIVPGHLGQAWLGPFATRFFTITSAEITVENNIDLRDREFGGGQSGCLVAGERRVTLSFSLFERDNDATKALYQAARQRSPISVFFQLGQQPGEMCGVWLTSVVPEIPEFDDSETRLQWRFDSSVAQGIAEDEIFVAFG
jgi:hypothetical protein